jgi:hypothetical protein
MKVKLRAICKGIMFLFRFLNLISNLIESSKLQCKTPEKARHVGVVCKKLHVAQPEVGINISLSDEGDIIEFSVFY